jgi:NNP family nitrate/nitrite transporter-like MFS transporter
MALGVLGVMYFLPQAGSGGNLTGFFSCFIVLFVAAGIGNGSTFRMIPVIFTDERLARTQESDAEARAAAIREGNKQAAAVLGFTAALGAYGGFFIPKSYGTSIAVTGTPHAALWFFIVFYATCIVLTWWYYSRRRAERPC